MVVKRMAIGSLLNESQTTQILSPETVSNTLRIRFPQRRSSDAFSFVTLPHPTQCSVDWISEASIKALICFGKKGCEARMLITVLKKRSNTDARIALIKKEMNCGQTGPRIPAISSSSGFCSFPFEDLCKPLALVPLLNSAIHTLTLLMCLV